MTNEKTKKELKEKIDFLLKELKEKIDFLLKEKKVIEKVYKINLAKKTGFIEELEKEVWDGDKRIEELEKILGDIKDKLFL